MATQEAVLAYISFWQDMSSMTILQVTPCMLNLWALREIPRYGCCWIYPRQTVDPFARGSQAHDPYYQHEDLHWAETTAWAGLLSVTITVDHITFATQWIGGASLWNCCALAIAVGALFTFGVAGLVAAFGVGRSAREIQALKEPSATDIMMFNGECPVVLVVDIPTQSASEADSSSPRASRLDKWEERLRREAANERRATARNDSMIGTISSRIQPERYSYEGTEDDIPVLF